MQVQQHMEVGREVSPFIAFLLFPAMPVSACHQPATAAISPAGHAMARKFPSTEMVSSFCRHFFFCSLCAKSVCSQKVSKYDIEVLEIR